MNRKSAYPKSFESLEDLCTRVMMEVVREHVSGTRNRENNKVLSVFF